MLLTGQTGQSTAEDQEVVRAYRRAEKVHEGQVMLCLRTPFITHPLQVLAFVSDWGIKDTAVRQAEVLHETLQPHCENPMTFSQLQEEFGEKVANLVHECTFVYEDQNLHDLDPKIKKSAIKLRRLAISEFYTLFQKKKSVVALVVAVADSLAVTADLISQKPKNAVTCHSMAKPLYTAMMNRKVEIVEALNPEIWARMKYQHGLVAQKCVR
jgi:(p)ppGpp synthase/HD superfamily hydrolase